MHSLVKDNDRRDLDVLLEASKRLLLPPQLNCHDMSCNSKVPAAEERDNAHPLHPRRT